MPRQPLPLLLLLLQLASLYHPCLSAEVTIRASSISSITDLLDLHNDTLATNFLSTIGKGYVLNSSFAKETLSMVEGSDFRHTPRPAHWDRYHSSWFALSAPHIPSLRAAQHRILLSSVRDHVGDGIGHMYYMYNFEVFLAMRLGLAFTHRRSQYQSLTKKDPAAVDDFFGWGEGFLPREAIWAECDLSFTYGYSAWNAQKCVACEAVTGRGPRGFKRVVNIPDFLVYNCTSKHRWSPRCDELAHRLLTEHNESHTIFQMPPGACDYEGTNTNVTETGPWFYHKYWTLHGRRTSRRWPTDLARKRMKAVRYDPRHLNIAVHIRRGDFFRESKRRMFSDAVFARAVADVLDIVDSSEGIFSKATPVVHIYSEGKLLPKKAVSLHDVDAMDNVYYDEKQRPRSATQWQDLIKGLPKSDDRLKGGLRKRIRVLLHISEGTLANMHEMVSADVFIGSDSSMSIGPVYTLSRGVRLLASHPLRRQDTLFSRFNAKTGIITDADRFYRAWMLYEAANGPSLLYFMQHASL